VGPAPNAPEGIRGEFREINTAADGIRICEHLPQMARVMDRTTVVRSLAHTIPSHGPATVFMTTGNRPTPALQYPALGSLVTKLVPAPPACLLTSPSRNCVTAALARPATSAPPITRSSSKATRPTPAQSRRRHRCHPSRSRHHAAHGLHARTA